MGLEEAIGSIMRVTEELIGAQLGVTEVPVFSDIETGTTTRAMEIG
jgi:hypothetical protein